MPKKKVQENPEEQSERFKKEVERLIAAGELDPIEADAAMDRLVRKASTG
jgi:hypothetical protein